jgi:hypothetical protein
MYLLASRFESPSAEWLISWRLKSEKVKVAALPLSSLPRFLIGVLRGGPSSCSLGRRRGGIESGLKSLAESMRGSAGGAVRLSCFFFRTRLAEKKEF